MRRIVQSLAALSVLALGACSGGGSVLNFDSSSTPDHVILTVQGPTNLARVLPGAGLPISAVAVRGTQNGFINSNRFKWSAVLTTGQTYNFTADGNQQRNCASINVTSGGVTSPLVADWGIYIAIDPTNEANIEFIPPTIIPVPTGATSITPNYPYCVTVSATVLNGSGTTPTAGATGSITVVVVNPQSPLG